MVVEEGKPIPDFEALSTSGELFHPNHLLGKKCVLYFYPKDDTPGCTREAQGFRDAYEQFQALSCEIFGVSRDSMASHLRFKEKYQLPFELLADENALLCNLFGVIKIKKMYGRESLGVERSTFVIDEHGILRKAWRNVKGRWSCRASTSIFTNSRAPWTTLKKAKNYLYWIPMF